MGSTNVRLVPNVVALKLSEVRDGRSEVLVDRSAPKQHKDHLTYFQLVGLRLVAPLLYPSIFFQRENLSERQTAEMNAYLQPGSSSVWPELADLIARFRPMASARRDFGEPDWDHAGPFNTNTPEQRNGTEVPETEFDLPHAPSSTDSSDVEQVSDHPNETHAAASIDGQQQFLAMDIDASSLVLAPPGTGKTHALIERLRDVISSFGSESPIEAVLVLSFTRSAVAVILGRLLEKIETGGEDDLRFLNVRTFDSYATQCLLEDREHEDLLGKDYDQRISLFNNLLKSESEYFELALVSIDKIRFFFVDEIQDLVGLRAEMVLLIARRVLKNGGSVTVLGDPAQAIYDYQIQDQPDRMDSRQFLEEMREILHTAPKWSEIKFGKFWRFINPELESLIKEACDALGHDGTEPDGARLSSMISCLDRWDVDDLFDVMDAGVQTVVLTRANVEMHQLARWCTDQGLEHQVVTQSRQAWPPWIARLLAGFRQDEMSRAKAEERWRSLLGDAGLDFDRAWRFLQAEGVADESHVDLVQTNRVVRQKSPDKPFGVSIANCNLTISNIHKSKGREYDRVLVLAPNLNSAGDPEEVRILYVAATRAREHLATLDRNRRVFRRVDRKLGREVVRIGNSLQMIMINGLDDLDMESILKLDGSDEDFWSVQKALWAAHLTETLSSRIRIRSSREHAAFVELTGACQADSAKVSGLSAGLAQDLRRAVPLYAQGTTVCVERFSTVSLCTYAFDGDDPRVAAKLGSANLMLVPVVFGLGELSNE